MPFALVCPLVAMRIVSMVEHWGHYVGNEDSGATHTDSCPGMSHAFTVRNSL
jgi:hypothetical protein